MFGLGLGLNSLCRKHLIYSSLFDIKFLLIRIDLAIMSESN